jgi:hypothetical protein
MKSSPRPVHETAHVALSAYVPAPMMGESPTRPHRLLVSPPVDVAAARLPLRSTATAPTVPRCVCGKSSEPYSPFFFSSSLVFCSSCQRCCVAKYALSANSSPWSRANCVAPSPTSMT